MTEPVAPKGADRSLLFLGLAVAVAGLTAFGAWWVVSSFQEELVDARQSQATTEALVATRDLGAGSVLAATDMLLGPVPASLPMESRFTNKEDLLGEMVIERIIAGEPLRTERLTTGNSMTLAETLLKPGTRAVTVKLDAASGVGGMLSPGAFVDVVVTIRPDVAAGGASTGYVTETILQAIRVLAVGDEVLGVADAPVRPGGKAGKERKAATVPRDIFATLEVVPDEVEKLAMATARGELYLSLRARDDLELITQGNPLGTAGMLDINPDPSAAREQLVQSVKEARAPSRTAPRAAAPGSSGSATVIQGGREEMIQFEGGEKVGTTGQKGGQPKKRGASNNRGK